MCSRYPNKRILSVIISKKKKKKVVNWGVSKEGRQNRGERQKSQKVANLGIRDMSGFIKA